MALVTKPNTFTDGTTAIASQVNANFDTLYNDYNGNITQANLSPTIAITDTQLAQITTASKVSGAAITSINALPSGAGKVPTANLGTGSADNTVFLRGDQTWAAPSVTASNAWSGALVKFSRTQDQTLRTLTHSGSAWGIDTSKPQNTEGAPYANLDTTHTALSTLNTLLIKVYINASNTSGNGSYLAAALFRDSAADAIATAHSSNVGDNTGGSGPQQLSFTFSELPADTAAHTYKVRLQYVGSTTNVIVNTADGGATNNFGGTLVSSMTIEEIKA